MIFSNKKIKEVDLDLLSSNYISNGKLNEFLMIVPTNRKLRTLKKEIIKNSPSGSSTKIQIETLGTLSGKLLKSSNHYIELSETASSVLMNQITSKLDFGYFNFYKSGIPTGTAEKIKNVIAEYKKNGISPGRLLAEAEKLNELERLKALDIASIYKNYSAKLKQLSAFDVNDIYNGLVNFSSNQFEKVFKKEFECVQTIILNGFNEFSTIEIKILEKLSKVSNVEIFVNFDYANGNNLLFSHLDKTISKLKEINFITVDDISKSEKKDFKEILRKELFTPNVAIQHSEFKNSISSFTASNRRVEIIMIAKEIKRLISEEGIQPSKIAVAFNLISNYSGSVRNIFAEYGIPINLTDRIPLDRTSVVTSVINFLEILEHDYYYKYIFKALSSPILNIPQADSINLYRAMLDLKIISGESKWNKRLQLKLDSIKDKQSEEYYSFKQASNTIAAINNLIRPFKSRLNCDEFKSELINFISRTNLIEKIVNNSNGNDEFNIKALSTLLETVDEYFDLLKIEEGNDKKHSISFFIEQLKSIAKAARFNIKERSEYGVLITSVNEIRGLSYEVLFIGGLIDGDFPTRFNPEVFMSGSFKKEEYLHLTEQRYLFYSALSAWTEKLYLSMSTKDDGRDVVESTFLKDFKKLFKLKELSYNHFDELIYSKKELQENINQIEYPKGLFDEIEDKIEVEKNRYNKIENDYSGKLNYSLNSNSDEPAKYLKSFKDRSFSPTSLGRYAKCPFQFFINDVLRVSELEDPSEKVEPREYGSIIHEILFEFFSQISEAGIKLKNCDKTTFNKAKRIIFTIAAEKLENPIFESSLSFLEKEKLIGINGNEKDGILFKLLEYEQSAEDSLQPAYFEVGFGNVKAENHSRVINGESELMFGDVKIKGVIDRIDVDENSGTFGISDYKLNGKKIAKQELMDGLELQLPFYLFAADVMLNDRGDGKALNPVNMSIYSLKYKDGDFGKISSINPRKKESVDSIIAQHRSLINKVKNKVNEYVKGITNGEFGLSKLPKREEKVCKYCHAKHICRVEQFN